MSKKIKNEQKKFLGETLNQYDKALNEGINQLDKKNREQNHKISSLVNSFDNEFLEKDVEGNMTTLENSKDGMVIINEIQGNTEVNYCKDGEKELILNGDIDTQGESFVTITEGVDGGLVDVSLEGNTEINLSSTKDPVLVTREFDDINCNTGKLQYTIDDVTTINDEPGKVDIDRIVGNTMVNHAVNGSEELILNAHINESGDNNITLNGVTSDGGKVDVYLEGNTLVNVSNVKDDYITPTIEDKVDQGSVISLPEVSEGLIHIDEIEGNTLVNYCADGAKELTLNGDIDVEGTSVTTTEGVDGGLVDVICEGNTLVNHITPLSKGWYVSGSGVEGISSNINGNYILGTKTLEGSFVVSAEDNMIGMNKSTVYSLIFNVKQMIEVSDTNCMTIHIRYNDGEYWTFGKINKGLNKLVFTTKDKDLTNSRLVFGYTGAFPETGTLEIGEIMLLEGDWTDKEIPQYFEGMKSVGQDDVNGHKVEISSKNKNEINLPSHTYSFTDGIFGIYVVNFPVMGKTFSYRYDYEIISISEEQDSFYTNLAGSSTENPRATVLDFHIGVVNQRLYNGAKGTVIVDNVLTEKTHTLRDIRCIRTSTPVTMTYKITNFALYFSDNADTYIPYAENKKEILLNEPLRSLPNGTKDRFVKIGGKWFIERNCGSATFDGSDDEKWELALSVDNAPIFFRTGTITNAKQVHNTSLICDKVKTTTYDVLDSRSDYGINLTYFLRINLFNCDARNGATVQDLRNYLQQNPVTVVYELATPTYEPLEIESTLNTYNDTTHISNNSIIPCNMQIKNTGYNCILKPSTLYTVAVDTNKSGTIGINLGGAEVTTTNNVATITTPSALTGDSLRLYGKGIKGSRVRLLEGDKTNWIPSFFEGMKSSFEDKVQTDGSYKMEVLMSNENLLSVDLVANGTDRTETPHPIYFKKGHTYMFAIENCSVGCQIFLMKHRGYPFAHGENDEGVIQIINGWTNPKDKFIFTAKQSGYFYIQTRGEEKTILQNPKAIVSENIEATYTPNKSNKIQLSSIEPLRGVNGVHDRLVFKDGKLIIERNCIVKTVNGSENGWELAKDNGNNITFRLQNDLFDDAYVDSPCICNLFIRDTTGGLIKADNSMRITEYARKQRLYLVPTKEKCIDLQSFKQWLQQNPVTVVHQLAEPTYEEIPSDLQKIILESYANGTLFIDTNIPPTKVSFNCFEEELTYLYPSTSYTVQFMSDKAISVDITLGGTQLLAQNIVKGRNRVTITTPTELVDSKLIINGTGAKISEIVVTDTDREFMYFEGMKSVGECEELEVKSGNKNLFDLYNNYILSGEVNAHDISINNDELTVESRYTCSVQYWFKVEKGQSYTLSFSVVGGSCDSGGICRIGRYNPNGIDNILDSPYYIQEYCNIGDSKTYTFTPKNNFIVVSLMPNSSATFSNIIFKGLMLIKTNSSTDYIPHQSNTQTLTHEPLRAVGDIKDKYVLIDGKWYIERNCGSIIITDLFTVKKDGILLFVDVNQSIQNNTCYSDKLPRLNVREIFNIKTGICSQYRSINNSRIYIKIPNITTEDALQSWLVDNSITTVYALGTPTYEPLDYNPFTVYSDITHISNNSTIPCNMIIKNHGYNLVALKENTQYTLYVNKDTTNALTYRLGDYVEINSLSKFTFTTPETLTDKTLRIDSKGAKVKDLMLIEGTPTNDSIGYFDGLKSSYECEQVTDENDENYGKYKVDVKVVGKNLISGTTPNSYQNYNTTNNNFSIVTNSKCSVTDFIRVIPGKTYIGTGLNGGGAYYDKNKKPILPMDGDLRKPFTVPTGAYYLIANLWTNPTGEGNIQLEEGDTVTEYEPYFESTQTVYLNSPLLKGDEIIWKDNKIQHYHKMKTVVLDGSDDENWSLASISTQKTNVNVFDCNVADSSIINDAKISTFSDKLPSYSASYLFNTVDIEGIGQPSRRIRICLSKNKASTIDKFKTWLQQNPITVAYQLEIPYYEEISDYPLKLNVIANSSLSTESTIQVTNISFNIYEETLPYLYPNTKYYITFNADVDRNNIIIDLGGSHVALDCKVGFNKVEITTPSDTTNLLTFSGTGVNIDHVKVTQQDIDEYFEGMKSVGECEELEITSANSDNTLSNTQTLTHEPLRAVGEVKDRYVLIDNKWYIERNCGGSTVTINKNGVGGNLSYTYSYAHNGQSASSASNTGNKSLIVDNFYGARSLAVADYSSNGDRNTIYFHYTNMDVVPDYAQDLSKFRDFIDGKTINLVFVLKTPVYEPIDYNPFEVYSDTTHISANSLIPTNVVVKNHGYNCILKPSTTYTIALNKSNGTISAKLGGSAKVDSTNSIFTITTPSTLNDNVLRLSGSGSVKDIMILEGDKTVNTPSYFEGIESVFEQEYDKEKGKYRVTTRVEGNDKESFIIFYLNEPLRGTGTAKDKIFIQDGKVVVQRNCGSATFDGSERIQIANINDKTIEYFLPNSINKTINNMACICNTISYGSYGVNERTTTYETGVYITINKNKLNTQDESGFKQWLQANPTTVVYALAELVYEEADCDLSKLALENYENSSLIFESNIPVSANIRYSGEVPVVTQAKTLSSQVDNTTLDINENIIPYMCDIDYRIVELQLMNGDTQGEGIELLGIGDIEILGNENVLFNNREDKKHNFSYDMLKRDILSQRYSKEEYRYRLDRYLLANKISDEEYKELEGLLNNGE